jgi:hypothetical protein
MRSLAREEGVKKLHFIDLVPPPGIKLSQNKLKKITVYLHLCKNNEVERK